MCRGSAEWTPNFHPRRRSSSLRRRPLALHRRRISVSMEEREKRKEDMEVRNLRLYMENQCIIEENQKLKNAALLLRQENSILLLQLQHQLASSQPNKTN